MKLIDIVENINKSDEFQEEIYIANIAEDAFNLPEIDYCGEQERLTSYYFSNWRFEHDIVGDRIYFFDDKPVALGFTPRGSSKELFNWFSKNTYKKVKDYVLSFGEINEDDIELISLEEELPNTFKIEYFNQMLEQHKENAIYEGKSVRIVDYDESFIIEKVEIEFKNEDTENKWVNTEDLEFRYNIYK